LRRPTLSGLAALFLFFALDALRFAERRLSPVQSKINPAARKRAVDVEAQLEILVGRAIRMR